jgi:hypothetical protein
MGRQLTASNDEVPAGSWQVVARAHVFTERGARIDFFLHRNGRKYRWYDIDVVTTSKRAAWKALFEYAAKEYPSRLVMEDRMT